MRRPRRMTVLRWLQHIATPIIEHLAVEEELAKKQEWGYLPDANGFTHFMPVSRMCGPLHLPRDRKRFLTEVCAEQLANAHDVTLEGLRSSCQKGFRALLPLPGLHEKRRMYQAALIVNNTGELPHWHSAQSWWNKDRADLLGLRTLPEVREHFENQEQAGRELHRIVAELYALLYKKGRELADAYGFPVVFPREEYE